MDNLQKLHHLIQNELPSCSASKAVGYRVVEA